MIETEDPIPELEVYNDGIIKADLFPSTYVCIVWITNNLGYLQKQCVKSFFKVEQMIRDNGWRGWAMASELANTNMHKIIEKVGGTPVRRDDEYIYFVKNFNEEGVPNVRSS